MGIVTLAAIALFILAFGLISGRIQKSVISPPMVFVLFGLLVSNRVLGVIDLTAENEIIRTVAELTLILVLFTDASRINLSNLRREHNIPVRLLSLGLPLCIIFGTLLAAIVFDYLSFLEGAILATILAPTDAALGQAVVSSPRVPVRIRQALNVESGLNDGIALPILLFFISLAGAAEQTETSGFWIRFAAMQLVLGPIVGIAVGFFGGKLVERAGRTEWMSRTFQDLAALGLSFLAYALAELVNGNGFISAFCAGLTLGNTSRAVCTCLYEFAEAEGQLLTLLTFMVFGAVMVLPALDQFNWLIIVYGILSLTVVRIVPVAISLIGVRLEKGTHLFLGWFGPRGIASILYGLLVLDKVSFSGSTEIFTIVIITVLISVFAHGLTAFPAANWYAARMEKMKDEPDMEEHVQVTELPVRLPYKKG